MLGGGPPSVPASCRGSDAWKQVKTPAPDTRHRIADPSSAIPMKEEPGATAAMTGSLGNCSMFRTCSSISSIIFCLSLSGTAGMALKPGGSLCWISWMKAIMVSSPKLGTAFTSSS